MEHQSAQQSLIQSLLDGKSEAEQKRVWEIVAKTDISDSDPLFLVMIAMGSIEASVVEIPRLVAIQEERLTETVDLLTQKIGELSDYTKGLVATSKNLDKKLKAKLPRASRNSGLLARELIGVTLIGILAGTLFGQSFLKEAAVQVCQRFPEICVVKQEKASS